LLGNTSFPIKFKGKLAGEVTLQCSILERPTGSLSPLSLLKKLGQGIRNLTASKLASQVDGGNSPLLKVDLQNANGISTKLD
jgi:hypothetical protein